MKVNIRLIYLYLFSFVGLVVTVVGSIRLVELALKVMVFQGADRFEYYSPPLAEDEDAQKKIQEGETERQRQRELSGAIAMIAVGAPLYLYHWKTIQKENKK